MPDPVVIRCPACNHLLHVPEDYLGKVVICLECKASFAAPAREGDALTAPRPLPRRTVPAFVFVPMFGLLLLGVVEMAVNGYCYVAFGRDPEVAKSFTRTVLRQLALDTPPDVPAKIDPKKPPTDEERAKRDERVREFRDEQERRIEERAADWAPRLRPARGAFFLVGVGVFAGGLAFALRRFYSLAFLGCFFAAVGSPDLGCCFPGAIVGIWGFFALISEEGRRYFGKG